MSLSRRARRGIALFNSRLKSPRQQRYCSTRMEIKVGPSPMDQNILSAALAAAEAINASVQIVPKSENNPVAPEQEGGAQHDISVQPEAGETPSEGTTGGPQ